MKRQPLRESGGNRRGKRTASAVCVWSVDPRAADEVEFPAVEEEVDYFVGTRIAFVLKSRAMTTFQQNTSGAHALELSRCLLEIVSGF